MTDEKKLLIVTFIVPHEIEEDFMRDMVEEVRNASDLAASVVVKHYRAKQKDRLLLEAHSLPASGVQTYGQEPSVAVPGSTPGLSAPENQDGL